MAEEAVSISDIKINPEMFAKLVSIAANAIISSRGAKDVLKIMFEQGGDPEIIVKEKGLTQTSDDSFIKNIVEEVIKKIRLSPKITKMAKKMPYNFLWGKG